MEPRAWEHRLGLDPPPHVGGEVDALDGGRAGEGGSIDRSDRRADDEVGDDPAFDERMMALIAAGDADTVVREATLDRLLEAGNVTPGFLNYVMLLGLANGTPPRATVLRFPKQTAATYYMEWSFNGDAT